MRNTILFLMIGLYSTRLSAAIFVVNNNVNSPSVYTTTTVAISAANAGDTIYLTGSTLGYGDLAITKPLTIVGAGANPQKQLPYIAIVGNVTMTASLANVKVSGLYISGSFSLANSTSNFDLEYCFFSAGTVQLNNSCNNIKVSNCIFLTYGRNLDGFDPCGGYYGGCSNLLIQNCVFNGVVAGLNITGTVIQNNIFLRNADCFEGTNVINNGGCYTVSYINSATISNNIFYRSNPTNFTGGCAFNNNISYHPSATFAAMPGSGNLDNTDPQFVNFPAAGANFSYAYDFHLSPASPGHLNGSDGKDVGLYGGSFPVSINGEVYNMPMIRQMNISSTNVQPNGNINVKVRSTKSR
mgnify:CR=1 FL=1